MPDEKHEDPGQPGPGHEQSSVESRLIARIEALEARNRDLAGQMTALLGSTSWRMMRPVRGVMETLRRGRRAGGGRVDATSVRPMFGHQGHGAATQSAVTAKARWILDNQLFDAAAYRKLAGLGPAGDLAAAEHYIAVGEGLGLAPNPAFDPVVYADLHREVVGTDIGRRRSCRDIRA